MINLNKKPSGEHKLFFGEHDIGRLDMYSDPIFKQIAELDESNVWFLNAVDCTNDRWNKFPGSALTKFQLTVGYQTILDSLVPDVFSYLSEVSTDSWLSYLYSRIATMEHTHALSYSSGITQAFGAQATEFLDIIYTDENIKHRIDDELDIATEFINATKHWGNTEYNRRLLLSVLFSTFALEGVKFPFSFFTSWSLNKAYDNCAQGFSTLLTLISRDEMQVHTTTSSNVIKKLLKHQDFKSDIEWFNEYASKYMVRVAEKEMKWADHLLTTGEEPGFNKEICYHFIKYWSNRRLKEIGLPIAYTGVVKNDIEIWFDDYRNISGKQSALQEVSNISYTIGMCTNDLHKFDKESKWVD